MEKSKELTPMQEAKKQIAELWSSPSDQPTYSQIFEILESLLPKEKQVIEDAFYSAVKITGEGWNGEYAGSNYPCIEEDFKDNFNEYYNTKYKNYEI